MPRLAYADWLDEHDQPKLAEFIRVQCELERLIDNNPRAAELRSRLNEFSASDKHEWIVRYHELLRSMRLVPDEEWPNGVTAYFTRGLPDIGPLNSDSVEGMLSYHYTPALYKILRNGEFNPAAPVEDGGAKAKDMLGGYVCTFLRRALTQHRDNSGMFREAEFQRGLVNQLLRDGCDPRQEITITTHGNGEPMTLWGSLREVMDASREYLTRVLAQDLSLGPNDQGLDHSDLESAQRALDALEQLRALLSRRRPTQRAVRE